MTFFGESMSESSEPESIAHCLKIIRNRTQELFPLVDTTRGEGAYLLVEIKNATNRIEQLIGRVE